MLEKGDRLWTVDELADYLRLKPTSIYALISRNRVPVHRIGGQWRFRASEIEEWLEQQVLQKATGASGN